MPQVKQMSAFSTFFSPSGPANIAAEKDETGESTGSLRQRVGMEHSGGLATLIRYVNMSRVSDRRADNRIDVRVSSGKLRLTDLFPKDADLIKSAYAKLRTKLPPFSIKIKKIPSTIVGFLDALNRNLSIGNADAAIASLASYIAVFARLMNRIQATTVVEPAFNLDFLNKQANEAVGQLYFYLDIGSTHAWGTFAD